MKHSQTSQAMRLPVKRQSPSLTKQRVNTNLTRSTRRPRTKQNTKRTHTRKPKDVNTAQNQTIAAMMTSSSLIRTHSLQKAGKLPGSLGASCWNTLTCGETCVRLLSQNAAACVKHPWLQSAHSPYKLLTMFACAAPRSY